MKTRTRFSIIWTSVILALAIIVSMAQASKMLEVNTITPTITWWVVDHVDQTGDIGTHTSIAFNSFNGTPWISYYDADNTALKVAHYTGSGGNCGQANDWDCETVDTAADVGAYSSIDVYPDPDPTPPNFLRVGVAYYDATNKALKFAEYVMGSWNIVTVMDDDFMFAPYYGQYTSMKYNSDGDPEIAYYMYRSIGDDELNYAYQVISGGNCGEGSAAGKWHCEMVDSGTDMGQYASLDYSSIAGIAYYDGSAGNLKYAYYKGMGLGNCGTGSAWYCIIVDGDSSDVGKFASIHVPTDSEDKLQIAYYDATNGELKYAKDVDGSSGNCGPGNGIQCDSMETIGAGLSTKGISLAVDSNNNPIIAYRNWIEEPGSSSLKVAQTADSLGLAHGNCGHLNTWQCTTIDHGSLSKVEAEYTSVAFDPDGLAMIAYSEDIHYVTGYEYNLKIAYQSKALALPVVMK